MQDFIVDDISRSSSIGFDATDRDETVVTVGVLLNRAQEASLLDDLFQSLSDDGFQPFRTKSRDLSLPPSKVLKVLRRCNGSVGICVHQGSVTLPYAEAVHSAILLDELNPLTNDTTAIVDGSEDRAASLCRTTSALGLVVPPVVNCVKSELYYPHLLLADLVAGAVADTVNEKPDFDLEAASDESAVVIDTTRESRKGRWGRAYSAVARNEGGVEGSKFEQRYAGTARERISCWYHGMMAKSHAPAVDTDGVQPIVGGLNAMGCEDIATWIAEQ